MSLSHGRLALLALAFSVLLAAIAFRDNRDFYHDDAYITLRYAQNALAGHGVVWNRGERVQGYTNPLHLGLIWAAGLAGADLRLASQAIGVTAWAALVVVVGWLQWRRSRIDPCDVFWPVPVVFVLASCPLIVWSLGGLETTLFCLLVGAGCLAFVSCLEGSGGSRLLVVSALCLGLATLTRPDGVVFAGLSLAWLALSPAPTRLPKTALFAGLWLVLVAPYVLWQYLYYGDIVPNTFYTKAYGLPSVQLRNGFAYVVGYALEPPYLLPGLLVLLGLAWPLRRRWPKSLAYLLSAIVVYGLYVVAAGGDHMVGYRLMLPLVVPLGYALYVLLRLRVEPTNRLAVMATYGVILVLAALQTRSSGLNPRGEDSAAQAGAIVGRYISRAWPGESLVALNTAGSTPFYANHLRFIDMLGLNDAHIARRRIDRISTPLQRWPGHLKGDGAYVLSRQPDFIIIGPAEGAAMWKPLFLSDWELWHSPQFRRDYRMRQVWIDEQGRLTAPEQGLLFTYYERVRP